MSTKIRLQRKGKAKQPVFRVVVINSEAGSSAGSIEKLGTFNPEAHDGEGEINIDEERTLHWLGNGAQPSPTVHDLLSDLGLLEKYEEQKAASTE